MCEHAWFDWGSSGRRFKSCQPDTGQSYFGQAPESRRRSCLLPQRPPLRVPTQRAGGLPGTGTAGNTEGCVGVSVSERTAPGLTALVPSPGIYCNESERYEIRRSKRGHWYAMRLEPDGCATYVAQRVDLTTLTGPLGPGMEERKGSERQSSGCTPGLRAVCVAAGFVRNAPVC
jgi:hypothetical protein